MKKKDLSNKFSKEMKAIKFLRMKEYRRWFERLWRWTEFRIKTREMFIEYAEIQNKRILIDMIYDLKKIGSYRKISERRHSRLSHRCPENSLENTSCFESETERTSRNVYRFFLFRKTFLAFKKRIVSHFL